MQHYLAYAGIPTLTLQLFSFLDFRSATRLVATDTITASVRGEILLYADIYTPCHEPDTSTVLEGPLILLVSTKIAITFRDYGELEANRALSFETMYDEITQKEGLLTLSHLPNHLRENH